MSLSTRAFLLLFVASWVWLCMSKVLIVHREVQTHVYPIWGDTEHFPGRISTPKKKVRKAGGWKVRKIPRQVATGMGDCIVKARNLGKRVSSFRFKGWNGKKVGVRKPSKFLNNFMRIGRRGKSEGKADVLSFDSIQIRLLNELEKDAERVLYQDNIRWKEVVRNEKIRIWKAYFRDGYGNEFPCIKVQTTIDAPASSIMDLIEDSTRVYEYNRYARGRKDIAKLGPNTKIVRNRTMPPFSRKPHEFCTLMHVERRADGSQIMLTRATDHPQVPRSQDYVRSEILLGVTEVRPHSSNPKKTHFLTISHVKSHGVPPLIADRVSAQGLADYVSNLEAALKIKGTVTA